MAQTYAATINPGLELALVSELRTLGAKKVSSFEGGATFRATNKVLYRVVKFARCTNQVRLRVDEFRSRDNIELFNKTKRIDWARLLPKKHPVTFRVATRTSRLNDTRVIIASISHAMSDLGFVVGDSGQEILFRIEDDRCTISLDVSGRELYKRGYRTQQVAAPMRESLAACLLQLADVEGPIVDPCCGSGTIVIEAASRALGLEPRKGRRYPLEKWNTFDAELFAEQTLAKTDIDFEFVGYDIDPKAVDIANANARRAGVEAAVRFEVQDVGKLETDLPIVSNPPYDQRIRDRNLTVSKHLSTFANATFVVPGKWRGDSKVLARFQNGGTPVKLVTTSQR